LNNSTFKKNLYILKSCQINVDRPNVETENHSDALSEPKFNSNITHYCQQFAWLRTLVTLFLSSFTISTIFHAMEELVALVATVVAVGQASVVMRPHSNFY